jgi:hypothetical protein
MHDNSSDLADRLMSAIEHLGDRLIEKVDGLGTRMDALLQRNDVEHRMYRELESYREQGSDGPQQLSLLIDVIHVINRVQFSKGDESAMLFSVVGELEEALARVGVERIQPPRPAAFDPSVQRAVGTLDESAPETVRTVAWGYRYGERVLAPEHVLTKPLNPKARR